MEIREITDIDRVVLPLQIYDSVELATATSNDGEEFDIVVGLEKKYADEIKKHALDESDEELRKNTSDRKRFGENGSYEKWYAKVRTPFGLIHRKTDMLAGFAWFGPEPISKASLESSSATEIENTEKKSREWHTIGYRSYNPFRGKGLMKDFIKFAMRIYSKNYTDAKYWVGIKPENKSSIALSTSLGFIVSEENSNRQADWLVMTK